MSDEMKVQSWELYGFTFYLNPYHIATMTASMAAFWIFLWFAPPRLMRMRQTQTVWNLVGYLIMITLGYLAVEESGYFKYFPNPYPAWSAPRYQSGIVNLYFEFEISFYASSLIGTIINYKDKDFYAMFLHHTITPFEIYFSQHCGFTAIGVSVMFLHDIADVFLHFANLFNKFKFHPRITDLFFFLFAGSFFYTRIVVLPWFPLGGLDGSFGECAQRLAAACFILVFLHCFWFYLIIRMFIRFYNKGNIDQDIREHENNVAENKRKKKN